MAASQSIQMFDDIAVGERYEFGPYRVEREELLQFNRQWDPLPIHLDDAAAVKRGHQGIIASGQYTLCVKQVFVNQAPWCGAVIGAMGFDEVRFPHPVHVGDDIFCTIECLESRASRSKPDRGIVRFSFRVFNQDDQTVLSYFDTVMIARRNETGGES